MPRVELRKPTRAEIERVADLWCRAYVVERPDDRASMMARCRLADARVVMAGDDLVAAGRLLPLRAHWGGRSVKLGGVASLATAPEHRRQGHTQRLVLGMLAEMRRDGYALSALYPFDAAYYRRYGWALCSAPRTVRAPVRYFTARERPKGRVVLHDGDHAPLRALHTAWGARYNLTLVRDAWWYDNYLLRGPAIPPRRHVYRYDNDRGDAEGYVMLSHAEPEYRTRATVKDLVYTTARARAALLAFLGDQDSQLTELELVLPPDDPWLCDAPHFEPLSHETEPGRMAMARVVDVKAALDGCAGLAGPDGAAVFELVDDHASWNRGRWSVAIEGGGARVTRSKKPADAALSIHALTQLATGFVSAAAAVDAGMVTGRAPDACGLLTRFAAGLPAYHNDYY